jgi:nitroimidazol reductase NimA-like FMN-containing flavoprotein (pyridoxamine 5'-phosphate oxidase superfamily)
MGTSSRDLAGAGGDFPSGAEAPAADLVLDVLSAEECLAYLGQRQIGRFVFMDVRGPVAVPVNYKMLGDDVVFRTHAWTSLATRAAQRRVSIEVDHIDEERGEGWSVLVSGRAYRVTEPAELEQVTALDIRPWASGERETYIRIAPTTITGRRLHGARR